MPPLTKKTLILLALIVLLSTVLSVLRLRRDSGWADDFAAYILQAQSIVRGNMPAYVVESTFTMEHSSYAFGPVTEPWGFPLMLAPVYAVFGLKLLALKLVSVLCYALFLAAFFFLARTRLSDFESLVLAAVLAFNAGMLDGGAQVLPDIPFTLFSTLTIWLLVRSTSERLGSRLDLRNAVLVGVAIFAAAFTRLSGFVLLVPLAALQLVRIREDNRLGGTLPLAGLSIGVPYLTLAFLYAVQSWIFPGVSQPDVMAVPTLRSALSNLWAYIWLPAGFFQGVTGGGTIIQAVLLIFFCVSLAAHARRDFVFHFYILATLAVFLYGRQGPELRDFYPIWPLFVLFAFDGMKAAAARFKPALQPRGAALAAALWIALAIVSVAACVQLAWSNMAANRSLPGRSAGAFSPGSMAMFNFIKQKTPADSVIIFFKPRLMRLLTDRDSFMTPNCELLPGGDYVAILKSNGGSDQIPPERVEHCNQFISLSSVYDKDDFVVYKITHTE
jgi:4-amino-4-deoxy-L-arabinose transferase-like glycosyltransferase